MAIRHRKDRTHLVAEARVPSVTYPYYLRLYLWRNREGYNANANADSYAYFCSTGYVYDRVEDVGRQVGRCLGELHFCAGEWDEEAVAHEVQHAVLYRVAAVGPHWRRILNNEAFEDERQDGDDAYALVSRANELVCEEAGRWVKAAYAFLWHHDPPASWAKKADGSISAAA